MARLHERLGLAGKRQRGWGGERPQPGSWGGHGVPTAEAAGSSSLSPPHQPCHYSIRFPTANPRLRMVSPVTGSARLPGSCQGGAHGGCLSPGSQGHSRSPPPAAAGLPGPSVAPGPEGLPQPGAPQARSQARPPAAGPEPSGHRVGARRCWRPERGSRAGRLASLRQDPSNGGGRPGGQTGLGVTP